jgi:hypothetical protein
MPGSEYAVTNHPTCAREMPNTSTIWGKAGDTPDTFPTATMVTAKHSQSDRSWSEELRTSGVGDDMQRDASHGSMSRYFPAPGMLPEVPPCRQ